MTTVGKGNSDQSWAYEDRKRESVACTVPLYSHVIYRLAFCPLVLANFLRLHSLNMWEERCLSYRWKAKEQKCPIKGVPKRESRSARESATGHGEWGWRKFFPGRRWRRHQDQTRLDDSALQKCWVTASWDLLGFTHPFCVCVWGVGGFLLSLPDYFMLITFIWMEEQSEDWGVSGRATARPKLPWCAVWWLPTFSVRLFPVSNEVPLFEEWRHDHWQLKCSSHAKESLEMSGLLEIIKIAPRIIKALRIKVGSMWRKYRTYNSV